MKYFLGLLGLFVAINIAIYLFNVVNPWAGLAAGAATIAAVILVPRYWKNITLLALIFILPSCTWVEPNYEGVLMTNCGRNGIKDFQVVTGKVNVMGMCTELIQIPMFEQTGDVNAMEIAAKDGGVFTVDPAYTYQAIRGSGPEIAFNFRQFTSTDDFLEAIEANILSKRVINAIREEARNYTTDSLMRNMNTFEKVVTQRLAIDFKNAFFELKELTSGLKPPSDMADAIKKRNAIVIEAEQQKQALEREKAALEIALQKAKVQIEIAKAEAQANIERAKGLTDEVLREMAIKGWIEKGCPMPQAVGQSSFLNMIEGKKN